MKIESKEDAIKVLEESLKGYEFEIEDMKEDKNRYHFLLSLKDSPSFPVSIEKASGTFHFECSF